MIMIIKLMNNILCEVVFITVMIEIIAIGGIVIVNVSVIGGNVIVDVLRRLGDRGVVAALRHLI